MANHGKPYGLTEKLQAIADGKMHVNISQEEAKELLWMIHDKEHHENVS